MQDDITDGGGAVEAGRQDVEARVLFWIRVVLGTAAFAVAFGHTLEWLSDEGIKGVPGLVTACCVDVLAAVCLRLLLAARAAAVRWLATLGLLVCTVLSGLAQVHSSTGHGRGSAALTLIPLGAFAFLQIVHEVEHRWRARRVDREVDRTGGQVDSTPPVSTPAVHLSTTEVSTSMSTHLSTPATPSWDLLPGARAELPIARREVPVQEPERVERRRPAARKKVPTKRQAKRAPARVGLAVVVDVPAGVVAQVRSGRLTQTAAAAKLGCSTKTIQRALRETSEGRSGATGS